MQTLAQRNKITVIGSGNVGATLTSMCAMKGLGDLVLLDIVEGIPQGKALDIQQSLAVERIDATVKGTNSYADTRNSNIVVITAGIPRKPGMSRDELLSTNAAIVTDIAKKCAEASPNAMIIVVTNPLDVMVYTARKVTGFERNRVFGMSGILDTARYKTFLAEALQCSVENITAMVLGGHGDSMVPLPRYTYAEGVPVTTLLPKETLDQIIRRTRNGGAEIVSFLKTGSAYYAPAASVVEMIDAMIHDRKKILPVCTILDGAYGVKDIAVGVPAVMGRGGVEMVAEIELNDEERALFDASVEATKKLTASLKL